MVIRYAYLWYDEYERGLEEGVKDRPCAVLLAVTDPDGARVIALPITHTPPRDPDLAIEIPPATKRRLRLDDDRSWILVSEANRFRWPGPDLRSVNPGDATDIVYGALPADLFRKVQEKWVASTKHAIVRRTE